MSDPVAALTSTVNTVAWPAVLFGLAILYQKVNKLESMVIELLQRQARLEGKMNGVRRNGQG